MSLKVQIKIFLIKHKSMNNLITSTNKKWESTNQKCKHKNKQIKMWLKNEFDKSYQPFAEHLKHVSSIWLADSSPSTNTSAWFKRVVLFGLPKNHFCNTCSFAFLLLHHTFVVCFLLFLLVFDLSFEIEYFIISVHYEQAPPKANQKQGSLVLKNLSNGFFLGSINFGAIFEFWNWINIECVGFDL